MTPHTRDASLVVALAVLLSIALTWPMASRLGSAGRTEVADGQHGIWNVAWVAHALVSDPAALYDANIFYPATRTLAYSEANLVAGVMAVPAWVLTGGNPVAAFNSVVLLAFVLAFVSAFWLAREVGASRMGAGVTAVIYAYSPYAFAHLAHLQLLMTFGPALALIAMHRFVAVPSARRAVLLGLSIGLTALACAYYGIFAGLMVAIGILWSAVVNGWWRHPRFWALTSLALVVTVAATAPFFWPYLDIRDAGFGRSLAEARLYSASWSTYLASAALLHKWMLPYLTPWRDVLFPGFAAVGLAVMALVLAARHPTHARTRVVGFYLVGVIGFPLWLSFGPDAGLFTLLHNTLPVVPFLRAPVRAGLLVTLGLAVLSGLAITRLQAHNSARRQVLVAGLLVFAVAESGVGTLALSEMPPVPTVYRRLAVLPRAPVAEFPFYQGANERYRHAEYMMMSTFHWQPIINGYSDHFPQTFLDAKPVLRAFPSDASIAVLHHLEVRWVVVHFDRYPPDEARAIRARLQQPSLRFRLALDDPRSALYEVLWPPDRRLSFDSLPLP